MQVCAKDVQYVKGCSCMSRESQVEKTLVTPSGPDLRCITGVKQPVQDTSATELGSVDVYVRFSNFAVHFSTFNICQPKSGMDTFRENVDKTLACHRIEILQNTLNCSLWFC